MPPRKANKGNKRQAAKATKGEAQTTKTKASARTAGKAPRKEPKAQQQDSKRSTQAEPNMRTKRHSSTEAEDDGNTEETWAGNARKTGKSRKGAAQGKRNPQGQKNESARAAGQSKRNLRGRQKPRYKRKLKKSMGKTAGDVRPSPAQTRRSQGQQKAGYKGDQGQGRHSSQATRAGTTRGNTTTSKWKKTNKRKAAGSKAHKTGE